MTTLVHETPDTIDHLRARDVMTREVVTVDGGSSVGSALTLMRHFGVRHLPVTEHGRFLGLVDDRLVTRVSRLLRASRSDAVVVVDDQDRLLGLITLVDVVGAVAHALAPAD